MSDRDKNGFCIVHTPGIPVVPEVARDQSLTTQLAASGAAGDSMDFEFNIDTHPIIDLFVRCDVAIQARVFVRATPTDTFAQLGGIIGPIPAAELHPACSHLINAMRLPGSQARIRLENPTAVATTILVAQVHARSM